MEKTFIFLFKVYITMAFSYIIYSIIFDWYVYPKLGIYLSQNNKHIKIGCAQGFIEVSSKGARTYTFIDGKKYDLANIYFYTGTSVEDRNNFPFYKYEKRGIFEDDLIRAKKMGLYKCHKVKYVSIIDLGFWKKFYIYDYIQD